MYLLEVEFQQFLVTQLPFLQVKLRKVFHAFKVSVPRLTELGSHYHH